jgi:hypothetical protein
MLEREEHIEQAYLFKALVERGQQNVATQDLLLGLKEEILATSKLALAIDYLVGELKHAGVFSTAMSRMPHYFTPFQTFVIAEAERERGRFDFFLALEILRREAEYRAAGATRQGVFLYEFESLSRNRLGYDYGLDAVAADPTFDEAWKNWIVTVRRQVGLVDIADMIYVRSEYFQMVQKQRGHESPPEAPTLFGEKEGRIAFANRRKDPLYLFAALNRQLGYPEVPRQKPIDETPQLLPTLLRRMERLETRIKLLEEEQRGGIDLTKFYAKPTQPPNWTDESPTL